jgi:hypothetical protein
MIFTQPITYLWIAFALLIIGSVYLIIEGYRVHKLFMDSIVGKLIKTLVVILIIELYSLGIAVFAFLVLNPRVISVLFPIVILWIVSLAFAISAVRSAKNEVVKLVK